jgi:hypothetical protein
MISGAEVDSECLNKTHPTFFCLFISKGFFEPFPPFFKTKKMQIFFRATAWRQHTTANSKKKPTK